MKQTLTISTVACRSRQGLFTHLIATHTLESEPAPELPCLLRSVRPLDEGAGINTDVVTRDVLRLIRCQEAHQVCNV